MTMEAYVLCPRPIASIEDWQAAIDALGFDLRFRQSVRIAEHSGHLPAVWRDREAGFEFCPFPVEEIAEIFEGIDLGGPWPHAYAFYFGTFPACVGTWFAVAGCLRLMGGLALDAEAGRILTPEEALRHAQETVAEVERIEADMRGDARR